MLFCQITNVSLQSRPAKAAILAQRFRIRLSRRIRLGSSNAGQLLGMYDENGDGSAERRTPVAKAIAKELAVQPRRSRDRRECSRDRSRNRSRNRFGDRRDSRDRSGDATVIRTAAVEHYIAQHQLDNICAGKLRSLAPEMQDLVMRRDISAARNVSAVVSKHVRQAGQGLPLDGRPLSVEYFAKRPLVASSTVAKPRESQVATNPLGQLLGMYDDSKNEVARDEDDSKIPLLLREMTRAANKAAAAPPGERKLRAGWYS